jgi:hypothetical protein
MSEEGLLSAHVVIVDPVGKAVSVPFRDIVGPGSLLWELAESQGRLDELVASSSAYMARCDCTWRSPVVANSEDARLLGQGHLRDLG